MCPFCFATAAAIAAGVVSTGGLALATLKRASGARPQTAEPPKSPPGLSR